MNTKDTIFGEMTFPLKSALRVIRISGDNSKKVLISLFKSKRSPIKEPGKLIKGKLLNNEGKVIDDCMCVFFKGPNSYTGEDILEIHCHGSNAIVQSLLNSLRKMGLREAARGEFSYRAFINGKLSLIEAKNIKKIFEAETALEAPYAYSSSFLLDRKLKEIKEETIQVLSLWEARIDFPEEVDSAEIDDYLSEFNGLKEMIKNIYRISKRSIKNREGFKVAIFGAPNSGKSSLFNNLLGRERAIVSPHPGTTRDIIEEKLDIDGFPIIFYDMAGFRKSKGFIEKKGIEMALDCVKCSDLVLFLFDGKRGFKRKEEELYKIVEDKKILLVATKKDLYKKRNFPPNTLEISNITLEGIDDLIKKIKTFFRKKFKKEDFIYTDENENFLIEKLYNLSREVLLALKRRDELFATELLKKILFEIDSFYNIDSLEKVYDNIFSTFCIGK